MTDDVDEVEVKKEKEKILDQRRNSKKEADVHNKRSDGQIDASKSSNDGGAKKQVSEATDDKSVSSEIFANNQQPRNMEGKSKEEKLSALRNRWGKKDSEEEMYNNVGTDRKTDEDDEDGSFPFLNLFAKRKTTTVGEENSQDDQGEKFQAIDQLFDEDKRRRLLKIARILDMELKNRDYEKSLSFRSSKKSADGTQNRNELSRRSEKRSYGDKNDDRNIY